MGSNHDDKVCMINEAESSETTIEIKVKTLDSQTYTLRVNKQMPVPELKEQIASVTGVLSEQQRLICRGRVLKDDQLLSAYHVEDGHTLHLVARQPFSHPTGSLPGHSEPDSASYGSWGQRFHVAPGGVIDVTDLGDGVHQDINQIVSAVLGAFGINNAVSGIEVVEVQAHDSDAHRRTTGDSDMSAPTQVQPEQAGIGAQSDRSHGANELPFSLGSLHPHLQVIPDSLTTLSNYLTRMTQEFGVTGGSNADTSTIHGTPRRESSPASASVPISERLPTPEYLAEVLHSTRGMLVDQVSQCLLHLGDQLHNQLNVTDPAVRERTQSDAWRSGVLFQNLGAFLLELGRTTMTVRIGQAPSQAVVNAGPAVYISQTRPNPLMVQPLPFQPGASFGVPTSTGQGGVNNGVGAGLFPRRIDIQIRRGEQANSQLPAQTLLAALPRVSGRLPGLGRYQRIASGHVTDRRSMRTQSQQTSDSVVQQNTENQPRDSFPANSTDEEGSLPASSSHRYRFNVLAPGETENHQPSQREIPSEVHQFLRTLFPSGQIHVEDAGLRSPDAVPVPDDARRTSTTSNAQGTDPGVTDEGNFLSNLLRQIMPFISEVPGSTSDVCNEESSNASVQRTTHGSSAEAENEDAGTSHRRIDAQPSPPNAKRQKME